MDIEDDYVDDYVNLTGVFTRSKPDVVGVRLDSRYPDYSALTQVATSTGTHTKFLIKGAWYCGYAHCAMRWAMIEGDAFFIVNDDGTLHFRESRLCAGCARDCFISPVAVFVEYISKKALDDLSVRLQRQEARSQQRDRRVAEVHVLANTGTQQSVPSSAHPGRVLGPNGELPEWFYAGREAPKE